MKRISVTNMTDEERRIKHKDMLINSTRDSSPEVDEVVYEMMRNNT